MSESQPEPQTRYSDGETAASRPARLTLTEIDLSITGQDGTHGGKRIPRTSLHVGGPADHAHLPGAAVHGAHGQAVGVGVPLDVQDLPEHDIAQSGPGGADRFDRSTP